MRRAGDPGLAVAWAAATLTWASAAALLALAAAAGWLEARRGAPVPSRHPRPR